MVVFDLSGDTVTRNISLEINTILNIKKVNRQLKSAYLLRYMDANHYYLLWSRNTL
jgi:hypothetical protein